MVNVAIALACLAAWLLPLAYIGLKVLWFEDYEWVRRRWVPMVWISFLAPVGIFLATGARPVVNSLVMQAFAASALLAFWLGTIGLFVWLITLAVTSIYKRLRSN